MIRRIHDEANAEFDEAWNRYDDADPELGRRFYSEFFSKVDRILGSPGRYAKFSGRVRRCLLEDNFPFSILYGYNETELYIVAVMHHSRRPGYWKHRVKDMPSRMK